MVARVFGVVARVNGVVARVFYDVCMFPPVKMFSGVNQERNLHRSKQSKTALNKYVAGS